MKENKGIANAIRSDKEPYYSATGLSLEDFKECVRTLHNNNKDKNKAFHLTNALGTFKIVNGFWYISLGHEDYIQCESPYDKNLQLKDKVTLIQKP